MGSEPRLALWEQPPIPWWAGGGALALWTMVASAGFLALGVALDDGSGWSGWGMAMMAFMGIAAGLVTALLALAFGDRRQRALALLAILAAVALAGAVL